MKNKRELGSVYEKRVVEFLKEQDYEILARNFHCRFGEIDIICKKNGVLVFVEVKYRSSENYGTPAAAVDMRKQRRISNTASFYMYCNGYSMETACRFDVAAVSTQSIELVENAFSYHGRFAY